MERYAETYKQQIICITGSIAYLDGLDAGGVCGRHNDVRLRAIKRATLVGALATAKNKLAGKVECVCVIPIRYRADVKRAMRHETTDTTRPKPEWTFTRRTGRSIDPW